MRSLVFSLPDAITRRLRRTAARIAAHVAAFAVAVVVLAGCASGAPGTATPTVAAKPTVSGAWVRPPQGMDLPAASYFVITGGAQADALLSASSPIAGAIEMHETTTGSSGMTGMQPVARVEVPAGATVAFAPGGYHLMLMNITGTLVVGTTVRIDLVFEHAGTVSVQAEVRAG